MNKIFTFLLFALSNLLPLSSFSQSWANDNGGVYNIPAEEYNPTYYGYGSTDNSVYNKIDLQNGQKMQINSPTSNKAALYDYLGNKVADAWDSPIGRDIGNITNAGYTFRDGGIIAASIAQIRVGNTNHTMAYAWSVNTQGQGRRSGWIKLSDLTPSNNIKNILESNKNARMNILQAGGINNATYDEYKVISAFLPSTISEYYLDPGRSASYTAGKARFYYTVAEDNGHYISGIKNIPETSRQRFGVAHNNLPINAKFYKDRNYPVVKVNIYAPNSYTANSHKLELVWGYTVTGAGEKIWSFVNRRALQATGNNDVTGNDTPSTPTNGGSQIVHITKRNKSNFALDGRNGAANGQNIHLWSANSGAANQQWIEINRGGGYYSYQKVNTNHCIDGGSGGGNGQNVKIWSCNASNQNQHWKKVATDGGAYKLIKRNSQGFAIDGGNGGTNGQNVSLYNSNNSSHNLQWFIKTAGGASPSVKNIAPDGTASQTSTAHGGSAARAIDRNKSGNYWQNSVTHTRSQYKPYWQVKWNTDYVINEVKIYNRTDCCTSRLSNFKVLVYNASGNIVFTRNHSGTVGSPLTINTGGVVGKHVRIQLNGTNPLSLAEVEVFGYAENASERSSYSEDNFLHAQKEMGQRVALTWMVDDLHAPVRYEVEYSKEDSDFELLETISIDQDDSRSVYNFLHNSPDVGENSYRVKVFSQDGSEFYLAPQSIIFDSNEETLIFPNPTRGQLSVDLSRYMDREVEIFLTDLTGKVRLTKTLEKNHEEILALDLSVFRNGFYMLYVKGENLRAVSEKVSLIKY